MMSQNNENMNGLQRLWRKLRRKITGIFNPSTDSKDAVTDGAENKKRQFADKLQQLSHTGSAVELKSSFLLHFEVLGAIFEERGKRDGRLEINPGLAFDFIKCDAKELQGLIKGVFRSKLSVAETNKTAKKTVFDTARDDLTAQKQYVEAIEKKYRFDYKDFAVFIGILYILFSIGFLIADFPLSRLVVQQGFEIEAPFESWLLTIGITLIGVYFKIWWDEYINPAVEKVVTRNQPENLNGFEPLGKPEQKTGIRIVRWSRFLRGALKAIILLTALASIGILGYFRYIVYLYTEFTLTSKTVPPALESFWAMSGFISIAILFPFLGGICLSIGTDKVQNWRERRKAKKELKKKEREYLSALRANEDAQKEFNASTEYLTWCSEPEFIQDRVNRFTSQYNRGYGIGLTESNLEMDILTKAENVRKRMLGKNSFKKTQPIISKEFFERTEQTN
jgi:hypothetical protein